MSVVVSEPGGGGVNVRGLNVRLPVWRVALFSPRSMYVSVGRASPRVSAAGLCWPGWRIEKRFYSASA